MTKATNQSVFGLDEQIYTYDAQNRMIASVKNGITTSYIYDGTGARVSKTTDGETTRYYLSDMNVINETVNGAFSARNIIAGEIIGRQEIGQNPYYFLKNGHGDVVRALRGTSTVAEYDYDAFGNPTLEEGTINNPIRYAGEYQDSESGNIYLRARYYDPGVGRFISEDPIRDGGNWYIYCNNNPINLIDALGLAPTATQAASMAEHIYDHDMSNTQSDRTVDGWRLITVWNGREGMKMGIYIKDGDDWQNPSEYTIVFKGTTMTDLGDWQNNAEQLISPKSADMWDAINCAKGFADSHSQEITFVGHSKGGAEATAAAIATNKNVISFNPASLNFSDYGLDPSSYTASSTAYIVKGDIVNAAEGWFSYPLDKAVYLPQQYGGTWQDLWQTSLWQRVQNHLMPAVKSALKEAGY